MGKSDEKQIKKRAHKATDGGSKHKNKPSVDAAAFEATDDEGIRHSQWRDQFRQLCEYKVQFGHCLVPVRYSANPELGNWVSTQRRNYRLYQEGNPRVMTAERIRALESVGFDWGKSVPMWSKQFEQLCQYKVQLGHCLVPNKYAANPKLGLWVATQRIKYRLYQEGKPSPMTAERIRALESVGFDWGESCLTWNEQFEQLCQYKVQVGHCLVPNKYAANPRLGAWVCYQRRNYRLYQEGEPSPMTAERIRALESVGFDWGKNHLTWNEKFYQLCQYKVQVGHCLVPNKYAANPRLGAWVCYQRRNYRLYQEGEPSPMTAERIRVLESIEFDWGTSRLKRSASESSGGLNPNGE
jgi:hypothetical protein